MSELSEAMERAEKRLAKMSEADRDKYGLLVMQQELRRPREPASPSLESPQP